jgi:hypothetical protein
MSLYPSVLSGVVPEKTLKAPQFHAILGADTGIAPEVFI